eukprot:jgi/Galph1/4114/GphlegSOOS_G2782.1
MFVFATSSCKNNFISFPSTFCTWKSNGIVCKVTKNRQVAFQFLSTRRKRIPWILCQSSQVATWSPENDPKYIRARVCAVGSYGQGHLVLVHSPKDPYWILPILIGSLEAQNIALALSGIKAPRPSSYDLFYRLLAIQGAKVVKAAITHVSQKALHARIWIHDSQQVEKWVDARPSDAINIGVRFGCDLYVNQLVLRHSGERLEKLQKEIRSAFVRNLFPESFVDLMSRKTINAVVFQLVNEARYSSDILKWRSLLDMSKRIKDSSLIVETKEKLYEIYPVDELREQIKEAVKKEDFEKAVYLRDQIIEWLLKQKREDLSEDSLEQHDATSEIE